jgi:20S proteasome alpha/beta subunit
MTIAAGFVLKDGVLLCADTLISDTQTKEYGQKIFSWGGKYASVCFALAGNYPVARLAIEECQDALDVAEAAELSKRDVISIIRPIIRTTYADYVDSRPYEDKEASKFQLLVAVVSRHDPPALYVASGGPALVPVQSFECIGIGRQLGRYIAEPYRLDTNVINVDAAAVLGIQILAAAKERVDGVGGESHFVAVRDRMMGVTLPHDVVKAEPLTLRYRECANRLLMALTDATLAEPELRGRFDLFRSDALAIREQWTGQAARWNDVIVPLQGVVAAASAGALGTVVGDWLSGTWLNDGTGSTPLPLRTGEEATRTAPGTSPNPGATPDVEDPIRDH